MAFALCADNVFVFVQSQIWCHSIDITWRRARASFSGFVHFLEFVIFICLFFIDSNILGNINSLKHCKKDR